MKTANLFGVILLFVSLCFASCKKDNDINIPQLEGKWNVTYDPRLTVDDGMSYTFNADKTCSIYSFSVFGSDTTIYRTYIISLDNTLITFYDENHIYTEQYNIRKLSSKEMKWESTSRVDCQNPTKSFVKVRE